MEQVVNVVSAPLKRSIISQAHHYFYQSICCRSTNCMAANVGAASIVFFISILISACGTETTRLEENADPALVEYPVVYIERNINVAASDEDESQAPSFSVLDPARFNPGAKLILKANAFSSSETVNLSANLFKLALINEENEEDVSALDQDMPERRIDIRDLSVSSDGDRVLMSIRAPEIEDSEEQPKWNIWQYQHSTRNLTRLIQDDLVAEQGDDLMPSYLPDGRIVFASTRQRLARAILLDEGKPQYTALDERMRAEAFNIHIMDEEGENIEQLSFNLSHDFYPLVLQDGHILYSRWDSMAGQNKLSLYKMRPDGTENQLVYGWHSQNITLDEQNLSANYAKAQQMPNGELLLLLANDSAEAYQKHPILINIDNYIDAQTDLAGNDTLESSINTVFTDDEYQFTYGNELNLSGRIHHLFPLQDGTDRMLLTWDLCRVLINEKRYSCGQFSSARTTQNDSANGLANEQVSEQINTQTNEATKPDFANININDLDMAEPLYQLWLYDRTEGTQQIVASPQSGHMITEAIVMQDSPRAAFIADKVIGEALDPVLAEQQAGAIDIRSVYDMGGENSQDKLIEDLRDPVQTRSDERPARFIKIVRGVPMPPDDVKDVRGTDFGRSRNQLMREIIGYSPIQSDGSVKVKVPANVPFEINVVEESGTRVSPLHRQWLSVRPGEILQCHGCHERDSELPHGRRDTQIPSINAGALIDDEPFPNTSTNFLAKTSETMAQTLARVSGIPTPEKDLIYFDVWTDINLSTLNESIELSHNQLDTKQPNGSDCYDQWNAYCRIQINYQEHIQPLWSLERGEENDAGQIINSHRCTRCHSQSDAAGVTQVPAAQLDLSATASPEQAAHLVSYRELFFNDFEQALIEGIIVDRLVEVIDADGNVVFELDDDGELILDEFEEPIAVLTTVSISPPLSTNGVMASGRFFSLFDNSASHQDRLSRHELRLIKEWLDIGGQYYNTPFYPED